MKSFGLYHEGCLINSPNSGKISTRRISIRRISIQVRIRVRVRVRVRVFGELKFGELKFGELKFGELKFGELKRNHHEDAQDKNDWRVRI